VGAARAAAGSVQLPRTWRLCRSAIVPAVIAVVVSGGAAFGWLMLPPDASRAFSWPQRLTVAACLGLAVATLLGFSLCRVTATADGLVLVNVFRVRRVRWDRIRGLRYRPDDPWPMLLLAGEQQVGVMGIQTSDGPRSRRHAEQLADLIVANTG